MGVLTDLAGLGALGSKAQEFAGGLGQRGKKRTVASRDDSDSSPFEGVPGASDIPGSGMDDDNKRDRKRSSPKRS